MKISIKDKQFLTYLSILVGLYILPIILADFYYADDLGRSVNGGFGWWMNGRILSHYWYRLLFFGSTSLDISPLNQILAGAFLVLSGFLLYKKYLFKIPTFLSSLLVFLFIANPFFLSNLSYKYDSSLFGWAILFSIVAHILGGIKKNIFILYSIIALISALLFYQPALTIFIELALLNFIFSVLDKKGDKESWGQLLKLALITCISYILYYFITKPFIAGWILEHNKTIGFTIDGFKTLIWNFTNINMLILSFFQDKITWILFLCPFVLSWILIIFSSIKQTQKSFLSIMSLVLVILIPLLLYIIMLIPILLLQYPIFVSRVLLGFAPLLFFSFLGFTQFLVKTQWKYLIIFPVLYSMVLSYSYANTGKVQKNFDKNLVNYIAEDLKSINKIDNIQFLILKGSKPYPPERQILENKFPVLKYITREYFDLSRGYDTLKHYPIFNNIKEVYGTNSPEAKDKMEEFKNIKEVKANPIYSMKILGDTALIEYKNH